MTDHGPFADWNELHRALGRELAGLSAGEFVRLVHELPDDQQPREVHRGLFGRRREVRAPSPDEYFAQVLAVDGSAVLAELSGSTYAGGHHPLDEQEHHRISDLGWLASGDPDFPGAAGAYAVRWPPQDPDGLAIAITTALRILGARPDVARTLTRSR